MGIAVNGGSVGIPKLDFALGAVCTFADTVSSPAPVARLWQFVSYPGPFASPPTLNTPTTQSTTVPAWTIDGSYTVILTRTESDATVNVQRMVVGVRDAVLNKVIPSPGFDPEDLLAFGEPAVLFGWAGGASTSVGAIFLDSIIRSLRDSLKWISHGAGGTTLTSDVDLNLTSTGNLIIGAAGTASAVYVDSGGLNTNVNVVVAGDVSANTVTIAGSSFSPQARPGQLTDSSGGTSAGNTIAVIAGAVDPSAATKVSTANAVATLAAKINEIEAKLHTGGEFT